MRSQVLHLLMVSLIRAGEWDRGRQFLFHIMLLKPTAGGCRWLRVKHTGCLPRPNGNMPAGQAHTGPYFFEGDPKKFEKTGLRARISKNDTAVINSYVVYKGNSPSKTQTPDFVKPNPFGLKNMPGNVAEFCADWYQSDAYSQYPDGVVRDPKGPETGEEHVIRGGTFMSPAGSIRSAARDYTRTEAWLKTDPQMPKSIWWYSDCFNVGFRVVCEFDNKTGNPDPSK